jgi:hypothetical protein
MKFKFSIGLFLVSIFFAQNTHADFSITPITYNSEEAIDLVFIADGFTSTEQNIYHTRVTSAIGYLFDNAPFNSHTDDFNIYSIPTISNESGISVLGTSVVDTALKTHLNENNLPRLTGMPQEQRSLIQNELKKFFKKKIYLIVIMNTPTYAGSGEINRQPRFASVTQVTLDGQYGAFRELLIHELGHSFGELADEYGGACSYSEVSDWDVAHYNRRNVTYDAINDRKWDSLVANPQYILGANYCDTEWYRSSNNGIMRSLVRNSGHNELGQVILSDRIQEDLSYNLRVEAYQNDGIVDVPVASDRNIRIHADESILNENLVCNNLYVAEDSNLTVKPGVTIQCATTDILGTITYEQNAPNTSNAQNKKSGSIRYGCKDPAAINYTRFARHKPSTCIYSSLNSRPPHYLTKDLELTEHYH